MAGGVGVYDLSGSAGWALYAPHFDEPLHGILRLPPTMTNGSMGPTFALLFNHVAWLDRRCGGLTALGFEGFLAPTGGEKDNETRFVTSRATLKKLIGTIAVLEMCAEMLDIPCHDIHNMSWRRYWLGKQKRGTERKEWKQLSVLKAQAMGWDPKGDDDADALGQLHFLLNKLEIKPSWRRRDPSQDLIMLNLTRGISLDV